MSPSDGRVHMNINVRNEMSAGNRVGPEELRPAIDAMHGALSKHRALIGSIEGLFGRAVAESLRRSLEPVEDASDRADYAAMSVDREFENHRDYARHVSQQEAELAELLGLENMQAERDAFNVRQYSRSTRKPETVTLRDAVEFINSERDRLWREKQDYALKFALALEQQIAILGVIEEWAGRHATPRQVAALMRRINHAHATAAVIP